MIITLEQLKNTEYDWIVQTLKEENCDIRNTRFQLPDAPYVYTSDIPKEDIEVDVQLVVDFPTMEKFEFFKYLLKQRRNKVGEVEKLALDKR